MKSYFFIVVFGLNTESHHISHTTQVEVTTALLEKYDYQFPKAICDRIAELIHDIKANISIKSVCQITL